MTETKLYTESAKATDWGKTRIITSTKNDTVNLLFSRKCAAVITIDNDDHTNVGFKPHCCDIEDDQGAIIDDGAYIVNLTNDMKCLSPATMDADNLLSFGIACMKKELAPQDLDLKVIDKELLKNSKFDEMEGEIVAVIHPLSCPVTFTDKEIPHGKIGNDKTREDFKDFGDQVFEWFQVRKEGKSKEEDNAIVFGNICEARRLDEYFGPSFTDRFGEPDNIFLTTHWRQLLDFKKAEEGVKELQQSFGPRPQAPAPGTSQAAQQPLRPQQIIIEKAEDIEKSSMAEEGKTTLELFLTCGVINNEGPVPTIENVCAPTWTDNMKNIQELKGEKVRGTRLQRLVTTAFASRDSDSLLPEEKAPMEGDRCFTHLPMKACTQLLHGSLDYDSSSPMAESTSLTLSVFAPQREGNDKFKKLKESEETARIQKLFDYDITDVSTKICKAGELNTYDDVMSLIANTSHTFLQLVKGALDDKTPSPIIILCLYIIYAKLDTNEVKSWAVKHKDEHPFLHFYIFNKTNNCWRMAVEHSTNAQNQQLSRGKMFDRIPKRKLISMLDCALSLRQDVQKWVDNDVPCDQCPGFAQSINPKRKLIEELLRETHLSEPTKTKKPSASTKAKNPGAGTKRPAKPSKDEDDSSVEEKKPPAKKPRVTKKEKQKKAAKELGWIEPVPGKTIRPNMVFPPGLKEQYCFNWACVGQECKEGDEDRTKILDNIAGKKICTISSVYRKNPRIEYTDKQLTLFNPVTDDEASTNDNAQLVTSPQMLPENAELNLYASRTVNTRLAKEIEAGKVALSQPASGKLRRKDIDLILQDYQQEYGKDHDRPVITQQQGEQIFSSSSKPSTMKHIADKVPARGADAQGPSKPSTYPSRTELVRSCHMKIKEEISFVIEDPTIDEAVLHLMGGDRAGFLSEADWGVVAQLDTGFNKLVNLHRRVKNIDFQALREPRLDYAEQVNVDQERIDMASACLLHYGGDVSSLVRFCGGEYTAAHRDCEELIEEIKDHVDKKDIEDIRRIMTDGCPAELQKTFTKANKTELLRRGNGEAFESHQIEVTKTVNKEDRNSHIIPVDMSICRFSAYCQPVPQTANTKKPELRICWDGSRKMTPDDVIMNEDVDMEKEPEITFGDTKQKFKEDIYNLRISHPNTELYLALMDITSCFRWPKFNPEAAGAFCYSIGFMNLLCITTAMVFGYIASANSWEPMRRAIEIMASVYFASNQVEYIKHKRFLDMITIAKPTQDTSKFTKAKKCSIQTGSVDKMGKQKPIRPRIYVDDALICAPFGFIKLILLACIKAIFLVCGQPQEHLRQCPLSLKKWKGCVIGHEEIMLGLLWNTRDLTIGITEEYLAEVHEQLTGTWHKGRKSFTITELQKMLGKVQRLGEASGWVFHLLPHMYRSTAFALAQNTKELELKSRSFKEHMETIKKLKERKRLTQTNISHINFAIKQSARMKHRSKKTYFINKDLREELDTLAEATKPGSWVQWKSPIAHSIKRDPTAEGHSDACLDSGGGYSIKLKFIWYLTWPVDVVKRTLRHLKNNQHENFISINALEFASVIINYCAALTAIQDMDLDDPWPVFLAWCDNTSAVRWVSHACLGSSAGRALGRLFCGLLINSRLGINSKWLSTHDNEIADEISLTDLQSLPPQQRAYLNDLALSVDRELSKSKPDQGIKTEAARQAHFIRFMLSCGKDPCGSNCNEKEYAALLAIYVKLISIGNNLVSKKQLRSDTVAGYVKAINTLRELRGLTKAIDLSSKQCTAAVLYRNIKAEEDIARRRQPLTDETVTVILAKAKGSHRDSLEALVGDIIRVASQVGPRAAEIVQKNADKYEVHTFPSGKKVIKAMTTNNFKFFTDKGRQVKASSSIVERKTIRKMKQKWPIQKNRRNNEELSYSVNHENPDMCVINGVLGMIDRAARLKQDPNLPFAVYKNKRGDMKYLTAAKLTEHFRKCTKEAHPEMSEQDIKLYSCHSMRVWACMLLHQMGKSGDYIRVRLRWLSEAYRVYLRDSEESAKQHNDALASKGQKIRHMLNEKIVPDEVYHAVSEDEDMGDYVDIE